MEKSEEYQKLYSLLAGLASKGDSNTNDGTIPQISLKDLLVGKPVTVETKKPVVTNVPVVAKPALPKKTEVAKPALPKKAVIVKPVIKMPIVLVLDIPELAAPAVAPVAEPAATPASKPKKRCIIVEDSEIKCEACHKVFTSTLNRCKHMLTSTACKTWLALPDTTRKRPLMPPIHELVDKWLHDAISRPSDNYCQFCTTVFSNKGNLHKHYQTATVCNRLAYLSFMKLMSNLNK